jgi:TolB-like protein/DNA-binding winged helix-turn-helix (wHTH) protein/Tfp pilus assembly protein PilF
MPADEINEGKVLFRFGPYCLDPVERLLSRGDEVISLTPKAFDALLLLVENSGHLLEKEALMGQLWPETAVEDNNLSQCIYVLRRALSESNDQNDTCYIETVPRRGYRFAAKVERVSAEQALPSHQLPLGARNRGTEATPTPRRSALWKLIAACTAGVLAAFAIGLLLRKSTTGKEQTAATSPVPVSVAVLPFLNLSRSSDNEYLSDGVTEELTTALAEVQELRVVARTSAFQFRGKGEDVRRIGAQLNVGAVVEGSVARSGDNLHMTAQVINTQNGYHLWSGEYDGKRREIYAMEEQIVRQTIRVLGIAATTQGQALTNRRSEDPEAHDLYLEGRYLWNKRRLPDMERSVQLFEAAIRKDPNYALAYAGLADTYVVMAGNGQKPYAQVMPPARAAVDRALDLDPSLAEAHTTLAMLLSPWDQAKEAEFRRATELSPGYATAHHWHGVILSAMGRFQEADAELREAQILDPLSPIITEDLAENFYYWRRYDSAIEQVRRIREMGSGLGDRILGLTYIQKGMYSDAISVLRDLPQGDEAGKNLTYLACAYAASGQREEAVRLLNQASKKGYVPPYLTARAYVLLKDKDAAFRMLHKAYQQTDPTLAAAIKVDPILDPIRSDPEYSEILKRVGLAD